MSGYFFSAQDALVQRIRVRGAGNALDDQYIALALDFVGHPLAQHLAADHEIGRRVHRIGRRQIADSGEHRNAAVVGVFDGLVERGRIGAADDDRVDALVDELPHLLNLRGVVEVRLCDDDVLEEAELLPFRNDRVLKPVHHVGAPSVAGVGTRVADGPRRWALGDEIAVGAFANRLPWLDRVLVVEIVLHSLWQFIDAARRQRRNQRQSAQDPYE